MKSKNRTLIAGIALLILIILLVLVAPLISNGDPYGQNIGNRFAPMGGQNPLGTDHFGRDIWARLLYGGRITLPFSFISLFSASLVGIGLGLIAGFYPGSLIDLMIMRLVDILLAFPFQVIALAVLGFWGTGLDKMFLVVIFTKWAPFTGLTRSLTMEANRSLSTTASKLCGASNWDICRREVFPNIAMPLLTQVIGQLSNVILSISALSFFGFGSKPPTPEWGSMLSEGRQFILQAPNILLFPSLAIGILVLALNLINDGLRDDLSSFDLPLAWEEK